MLCPKCHANNDKVNETRLSAGNDVIRRRRQCMECGFRFTTYETIVPADIYVVKRDGRREDFKVDKLRSGIRMACWKRNISQDQVEAIVSDITNQLMLEPQGEVESRYIGELVMNALRNLDEVAYVRFASIYRHFTDPTEFIQEVEKLGNEEKKVSEPEGEESSEKQ